MCCFLWHVDNAGSSGNVHVGNTGDVSPLQVINHTLLHSSKSFRYTN